MNLHARSAALAAVLAALCLNPAQAITLGHVDTFEGGSTQGWGSGANNGLPPTLASGGMQGADDHFLLVSASGVHGPGGKLVALAGDAWTGDFIAAGVNGLTMDLINLGSTDLSLRLYLLGGPGQSALTLSAASLPAGSGWTHVVFDIAPAALVGSVLPTLANVSGLRLYHGPDAIYPGTDIAALLGIDNVTAVPEPAATTLLLAGLLALAWRRQPRPAPTEGDAP
jgi:hypothetical protein